MERLARCLACLLILAMSGCAGAEGASTLDGPRVRSALEQRLGLALTEASQIIDTATLADVNHVYSARTSNERILAVVFDSEAATDQILGARGERPAVDVVRRRNVVVLYTREPGTVSRLAALRSAIDAVSPD
jgi:hypothetical protein